MREIHSWGPWKLRGILENSRLGPLSKRCGDWLGPALDFQGFHVIFKSPNLGFSRISRNFQGPPPWIFKDFTSFSRVPALDSQGFDLIFKSPGHGFSRIWRHFQEPQPWIFKGFTSFSKAPAFDFQGYIYIYIYIHIICTYIYVYVYYIWTLVYT